MTVEWIGLATFVLGCLCLVLGRRVAIHTFIMSTLLGASAAAILTALGGANLPPAHLILGFVTIIALTPAWRDAALANLAWPRPGFWLLLTVLYGALAAVFLPRLLAGATYVFTFARTDFGTGLLLVPLGPVSGNITQTIYFVGDLVAFCVIGAFARDEQGKIWIAQALIVTGFANLFFAGLDYLTFFTGTTDYLAFLRNAPYRMLDTAEVIGIKRLVGSFPEASAFASVTLCLFAFVLNLWLERYPSRLVGPLALLLFGALIASTSTTAYGGVAIYLVGVYAGSVLRLLIGGITSTRLAFLVFVPLGLFIVVCVTLLNDTSATFVTDALQKLVLQKGSSASAFERSAWNSQAMTNFLDSYGLGVGIGSARASNVAIAVLANVGVIGALTYFVFLLMVLGAPWRDAEPQLLGVREAAASACLALLIAGCLAGTTIDLGLIFFVCAALAAAPSASPRTAENGLPQRTYDRGRPLAGAPA